MTLILRIQPDSYYCFGLANGLCLVYPSFAQEKI